MEKTDEDLMLECREGETQALQELFLRYKNMILNFSLRILGNRADAEDVTGDVFLMLHTNQSCYEPTGKFSTWLFTVTRNACISKIRKRKNIFSFFYSHPETNDEESRDFPDPGPSPDTQLYRKEISESVKSAIDRLPLSQKEAVILREYHGMSYEEIAQIMQISLENVKILIFRGRENLRKLLTPFLKEGRS